jgi:REG-2-like HAD superfamily hydrolase
VSTIAARAVTFDAAGTLLHPAESVALVYARHAARHGSLRDADAVGRAFRDAMHDAKSLRAGDPTWRKFWAHVVATSTACESAALVDELFEHYARADAWRLTEGTIACIDTLRRAGVRVGVISNWDTRLRPLLDELGVLSRLDALVVSGEVGFEKPDSRIFAHAAAALGVDIDALLHVGDDARADVAGARAAGAAALHIDEIADLARFCTRVSP